MAILRDALARDVIAVVAVKVMLLAALYFACFSPSHRPPVDAAAVSARLLAAGGAPTAASPAEAPPPR